MKRRQTALERLQTGITGRTNIPLAADKQTAGPRGSNVAVKERGLSVVCVGGGRQQGQTKKQDSFTLWGRGRGENGFGSSFLERKPKA